MTADTFLDLNPEIQIIHACFLGGSCDTAQTAVQPQSPEIGWDSVNHVVCGNGIEGA